MRLDDKAVKWLDEPEEHDYPAASSYLIYEESTGNGFVENLKQLPASRSRDKDIFRTPGLSVLGGSNLQVEMDQDQIKDGQELAPLTSVKDAAHSQLISADAYHRLGAVYGKAEDALIPCKTVWLRIWL